MKTNFKSKIGNLLLCFLMAGAFVSCEEQEVIEKTKGLGEPNSALISGPSRIKASITPRSGSVLTTSSVTFDWSHPGDSYWIYIGTAEGEKDIYSSSEAFTSSKKGFTNLPTSGTLYFRLFCHVDGEWEYNDFTYRMNVGGSTTSGITPADGSTLTESEVNFSWTHSADYYRIYLGTTEGSRDLYDSDNVDDKSHTVKNIPSSGTVYLRLWLRKNGEWEKYDYSYTANNTSGGNTGGDKDFIITAVRDDLDPQDMTIFANEMKALGYSQSLKDDNVTTNELKSYFEKSVKTLYHTGHGLEGAIATYDGTLSVRRVSTVKVENLIIATCLTMKDRDWKDKFSSSTENIMGYTKVSFDGPDDDIAKDVPRRLGRGKSYLQAWYEANNRISSLSDRWCCYTRSGSRVVEYSAASGNRPSSSSSYYSLANGKVEVASKIASATKKSSNFPTTLQYTATKDQEASQVAQDFNTLSACGLSKEEAITRAKNWVAAKGSFAQVKFDEVVSLYADNVVIGHQVRFKREINSLPVRGNVAADYVSLLVTDSDIATSQYQWSSLAPSLRKSASSILSTKDAIAKAADAIGAAFKGEKVQITDAVPCLGYKANAAGSATLVPAYEFIATDGLSIVVDASTGEIM